jgi:hypothetical protein
MHISMKRGADQKDPQNWRLDVPDGHVELYLELSKQPRDLTEREAEILVELVDAWRELEHRKQMALESARGEDPST